VIIVNISSPIPLLGAHQIFAPRTWVRATARVALLSSQKMNGILDSITPCLFIRSMLYSKQAS